ncbi:MAG: (R)-citramalate synthase [Verrucomicrobia subdivision 3 bacterium]|nr:(R)-citramalate synthase [Limisphaerales bacterium]MCS1414695.1 (R)-citramalate synthase [Limisphaerales bacterium]
MSKRDSKIEIYDTTLRDGTQGEGVNFSVADKLRLAERFDAFGIHYIEGGWPGSNPRDIEFFKQAKDRKWKNARITAFGSTRRKGVKVHQDSQVNLLLKAETPAVTIFGKTWMLHVKEVIKTSAEENIKMIADTVRFLKKHGRHVIYDAEHAFDGFKDRPDYALKTWIAAAEAGADTVTLCDTNGGCLPSEIQRITQQVIAEVGCPIGIHTHDDIGLGVANAIAAVEVGATQVQGTLNGYGERTGNCSLTSVIPNVVIKMNRPCVPRKSMRNLADLSQFVDEIANLAHDSRRPWVGASAFAHKGGMHVNAVQKVAHSFEHSTPESVGNRRRILMSDLAGRSNIVMKAKELGFKIDNSTPELKDILKDVKELEHQGYEFEAAEASLALLIQKRLKHAQSTFQVEGYHVSMRRDGNASICQATTKVRVGDEVAHTVAEGDGPVNALDGALRLALKQFFPKQLRPVRLTDYKVRILDSSSGTAAKTRVFIESSDGTHNWCTVAAHDNIIEASLQALSDSLEYRLLIQKITVPKTKKKRR